MTSDSEPCVVCAEGKIPAKYSEKYGWTHWFGNDVLVSCDAAMAEREKVTEDG